MEKTISLLECVGCIGLREKNYTMYVKKVGGNASLGSGDGITFAYSLFTTDYNHYFRGDTTSKNLDAYIARDVALVETELIFMMQCWRDGTVFNNFKFQIEVVPGTTAPTTYTPYTGQTAALTLPRTIYGGTVDAVSGESSRTWRTITLTGEERAHIYSIFFYLDLSADSSFVIEKPADGKTGKSSHYPYAVYTSKCIGLTADGESLTYASNGKYPLSDEGLQEWKAYLAAQYAAGTPVQIAYKLATPEPFTATGAQPISALSGTNTVITDADSVTVTGRADPIKRITDLEDAVASMTNT